MTDEQITRLFAALMGKCWHEWYIYDNEQGKRGLDAKIKGKLRAIKTLKGLLAVMMEGEA